MKLKTLIAAVLLGIATPSYAKTLTHDDAVFSVSDEMYVKYPELIELLLRSQAIEEYEQKQHWFDILPSMTNEQIDRLFNILLNERMKLERLDREFEQEVQRLNKKHEQESKKSQ